MKLVVLGLVAFGLVACAANGEVKVKASGDDGVSGSASASSDTNEKPTSSKPSTDEAAPPAQASSTPVSSDAPPSTCPLVCYIAQHGRVPAADEQKLASDLAQPLSALRSCGPGNSLTLRFDSTGQLTEFGVAVDRGQESACTDGVRSSRPSISYPGPSTLRCSERCGNDTTTTRRRRR